MDLQSIDPGIVAMIIVIAQFVTKVIPEDAGGVLGIIRKLFKLIGVYTSKRKTNDDPVG